MNELELLRELGEETQLATSRELHEARARLLDAIASEQRPNASRRRAAAASRNRRRRRFGSATTAIALAGAGAAAAAVVLLTSHSRHVQRPPVAERQVSPPAGHLTASQVLVKAAFVALQTNAEPPRPNQFVYTKVQTSGGGVTQSWLSVDGARNSVIGSVTAMGCVNGQLSHREPGLRGKPLADFLPKRLRGRPLSVADAAKLFGGKIPMDGPLVSRSCTPVRAYFPGMPTQPGKMLAYLERTQGVRSGNLNDLAKTVGTMLDTDYLLPAQQAALYEFLARTPGITVVLDVVDAAGRRGVGVRWTLDGSAAMLIFDPRSLRYLGMATGGPDGQASSNALVQIAIVDQARQLPRYSGSPSE